jgi:NADPH:quinone reductase-like Zn-dependent oxidoreductase
MEKMRATLFHSMNDIRVEEVERPRAGVGEAVIRVTLTTICGTDLHIVRGEYPVKSGLFIAHYLVLRRQGADAATDGGSQARARRSHAIADAYLPAQ